jgi:cytochrome c556
MRFVNSGWSIILALLALGFTSAQAGDPIEEAITYRQSAYKMIVWHVKPMTAMVKGKADWNADAFNYHAKALAKLSQFPINGFIPGSDFGDTRAKEEIWENWDDFQAKMNTLIEQSQALAKIASSGSQEAITKQFIKTARACKSCHKKYREKD